MTFEVGSGALGNKSLHDIQCLRKPGAGKRQNEDANAADNLVQSKKRNNRY